MIGADGSETDYTYTPLGQIATETDDYGLQYSTVTSYVFDAMGNVVSETVSPADGSSSLKTTFAYDSEGRQTSQTDNAGGNDDTANRTTTTAYSSFDGQYNTITTTYPAPDGGTSGGSTSIEKDYLDGSVAGTGGTAEVATSYAYGVVSDPDAHDANGTALSQGSTCATVSTDGGQNTSTTYSNVLGEDYLSVQSSPGADARASDGQPKTVDSVTKFDANQRPYETINFDGSKDESVYDPLTGQLGASWTSMDGSSTFDSSDSKTLYKSSYGGSSTTLLSTSGNQTDQLTYSNGGLTTTENLNGLSTTSNTVMTGGGAYQVTTSNPDGTSEKDSYSSGLLTLSQQLGTTGAQTAYTSYVYNPNQTLQYTTDYTGVTNYTWFQDGTEKSVQAPGQAAQTVTSINSGTEDPTSVTNPNNSTNSQSENTLGQTTDQNGAGIIASKYGYNADGQLTSLTTYPGGDTSNTDDTGAATTGWTYDPSTGLMTSKHYADGTQDTYKYNAAGQLKTVIEPGMSESFGYNAAGIQTSSTAIDSQTGLVSSQVQALDDQGRAMVTTSVDNGQISTETNTYTALGQAQNETFGSAGNVTVAHGYYPTTPGQHDPSPTTESPDALASMTIQNLPNGQANAQTTYGYDPSSKRLQTITVNGVTFTIAYVDGSTSQIATVTTSLAGVAGTALTTWTNPDANDPARLGSMAVATGAGGLIYQSTLSYNQNDQIITESTDTVDNSGNLQANNYVYTYGTGTNDNGEDANSLTKVTDNGTTTETYSYDGVGNFIDPALGDVNTLNQYAALSYNLRGDVTNDGTYAYTYDANDRMISVTPDNPTSGSDKLTYGYDSQGRRTWKDVYVWDPGSDGWEYSYARHYVYDGTDLVGELDAGNVLLTGYTWGPNGQLLAVTDYTQSSPDTYEAVDDAQGDTAMLVDPTNGTVAANYAYDSYGNLLTATGPAQAICEILGKGIQYDIEARSIGHALNRDVRNNIWYERDPAGEVIGGANVYDYLGGDPIDLSDASGLAAQPAQENPWREAFMSAAFTLYPLSKGIKDNAPATSPSVVGSASGPSQPSTARQVASSLVAIQNREFDNAVAASPIPLAARAVQVWWQNLGKGILPEPALPPGFVPAAPSTPAEPSAGIPWNTLADAWWDGQWGHLPSMYNEFQQMRDGKISIDEFSADVGTTVIDETLPLLVPGAEFGELPTLRFNAVEDGSALSLKLPRYNRIQYRYRGMVINPFARGAGVAPAVEEELATGGLSERTPQQLGVTAPPDHHIFPQEQQAWFNARGVDIDQYTVTLDSATHGAIHVGGGPGLGGGWWNETIMQNLYTQEANAGRMLTADEILAEGSRMLKQAKLDTLPVHPWNDTK